jgi:beta-barrel assembly-enhancing protease
MAAGRPEPFASAPVETQMRARFTKALVAVLAGLMAGQPVHATNGNSELPDIGTPANTIITPQEEAQLGAMVLKQITDADQLLQDPEVDEYIQGIGDRLASHAQEGPRRFTFHVVKDPSINAFAIPGGFVFVNVGLILSTSSESELAGVMAHEISHVTQRHTARQIQSQMRASLAATAAMLAGILLGAMAHSSDAGMAAVMSAQSAAIQHQLNYSREAEYEADRVGIGVMAAAGYDPNAMASMFETMGRIYRSAGPNAKLIEFLQNHPLTSDRVAEARSRAATYPPVRAVDSLGYLLTRQRLRVLSMSPGDDPREMYSDAATNEPLTADYRYYGYGIALIQANKPAAAVPVLQRLVTRHPDVIEYHTALGQALLANDDVANSRAVLERARELFPRNVPVTVRYAQTLMRAGDNKQAHAVLLDLFNVVSPTQAQVRLIALAANAAGETAEAYYYIAEGHVMDGDLPAAINTLRIALSTPNITPMQRSRFQARIDELKEYLPARAQAAVDRGEPVPSGHPNERGN